MPRINASGYIAAGVGGGSVSIQSPDGQWTLVASNAGQVCALDDNRFIYQHGAHLETYDTRNGEIVDNFDTLGANELAAGGGAYLAKFNDVLRYSLGGKWAGSFVGDVGPDGQPLIVGPDGRFQGRLLENLQAHGGGTWSATEGRRPVCSPGLPPANVLPGIIYTFRRFGAFCCYLWAADKDAHGVFVVQHLDRPVGRVLARTDSAYRSDLRLIGGQLIVTFASTEGEAPVSVQRFLVDPATLTGDLAGLVPTQPPIVVPAPVPPPQPKPEPPSMTVPNKSAELAAFHQAWNGGKPITDDAEKHQFTERFAGTLGNRFGRKSRAGNSPVSKDTLGYWLGATVPTVPTDGKVDAVDIISSSGAVGWDRRAEQGDPGYQNIDARWYPVTSIGAPPPVVTVPPVSSPDPALLARIRDLEQENAHLEADNAKLNAHPGYDSMMIMVAQAEAAFRDAQFGRRKSPMPAEVGAHLVYRLMFEGYSIDALVADARERGKP